MATLAHPQLNTDRQMQHVYGNQAFKRSRITVPVGQAVGDLINFQLLRKGTRITDFFAAWLAGNSAATTMKVGLAASPTGSGKTTYVDDDFFILAGAALNAAARTRWNNLTVLSVELDDDYIVQGTLAGANVATSAFDIEVTTYYEFVGNL